MAIMSLVSVPSTTPTSPHQTLLSQPRPAHYYSYTNINSPLVKFRYPSSNTFICSSSSSSSSPSVVEEEKEENGGPFTSSVKDDDDLPNPQRSVSVNADDIPLGGCKACGRPEVERGCNGEGRIQGGIATVPGFGWWPIKAYRPCPGYVASGGRYRRQGQSLDDIVSGSGKSAPATSPVSSTKVESKPSKKRRDPRKFKK
ncbi:uncharacterized protein LOC126676287 [Mercurialis annua]|uniref:uncharacterized protein LOC126676287 n=1 Tax=Mercurialis annua TaxID=3986 RepID=UPI00215E7005|nr:uncharacterized protein LOC126676287 [Mercurialis annua]